MNPWLVVLIAAAVFCAATILVRRRIFARSPVVRPAPAEVGAAELAALEAFGPLTIAQRLRIRVVVRRGKPLGDPQLVPAAVAHARKAVLHERHRLSRIQWAQLVGPALLATSILLSISFQWENVRVLFLVFLFVVVVEVVSPGRSLLRRYQRALQLNEQRLPNEPRVVDPAADSPRSRSADISG